MACLNTELADQLKANDPNCPLDRLFRVMEVKRECFINDLWEFIAYRTVSVREDRRDELWHAADWLVKRLTNLGVVAFAEDMGMQVMPDTNRTIKMPKTIIGVLTESPGKPTILVYGHLDVEDASLEEGWKSEPFILTERGEYLYGRGTACGKGPLLCWLNAIQCYKDAGVRLPINVVFLIESMAFCNSLGLEDVIRNRISFFREVSCVCISAKRWQMNDIPSIIYGTRGLIYYNLEVECADRDLNSCEHGGMLFEAMPDLFYLLSSLVTTENDILVPGIPTHYDLDPIVLNNNKFNPLQMAQKIGAKSVPNDGKRKAALGSNWAMPHISIHGIEGAHSDQQIRYIIPHRVIGKFSVSIAPNQHPAEVTQRLTEHLGEVWSERGSPNKMLLCEKFAIPAWTAKCDTPEYRAAMRANYDVYKKVPSILRNGGAILAPSIFERCLSKNVIVMPVANYDNCQGPTNESIKIDSYIRGSQMIAAFMYEYSKRHKKPIVSIDCLPKA